MSWASSWLFISKNAWWRQRGDQGFGGWTTLLGRSINDVLVQFQSLQMFPTYNIHNSMWSPWPLTSELLSVHLWVKWTFSPEDPTRRWYLIFPRKWRTDQHWDGEPERLVPRSEHVVTEADVEMRLLTLLLRTRCSLRQPNGSVKANRVLLLRGFLTYFTTTTRLLSWGQTTTSTLSFSFNAANTQTHRIYEVHDRKHSVVQWVLINTLDSDHQDQ